MRPVARPADSRHCGVSEDLSGEPNVRQLEPDYWLVALAGRTPRRLVIA